MSQTDPRRSFYENKLNQLSSEISTLNRELSEVEGRAYGLDDSLSKLPARIAQIRKMNYRVLTNLEKDQSFLSERWVAIGPGLKEMIRSNVATLRPEITALEHELSMRRMDTSYDVGRLSNVEIRLATLRIKASNLGDQFTKSLGDVAGKLQSVEQDVGIAESTLGLVSQASYPWKEGESPILAVKAKDLNRDMEGVITLTNQRFLFESEKEVVLKKRLFVATEKKKVRELVIDQPIGVVNNITKGRVGLLAGQGLFITFKPQSGLQEMKFDTKGFEADWMIRFNNFITSGQAEADLASAQGEKAEVTEKPQPLVCPRCGAPYTDELYRGQTSVKCRYCGVVIPVP